MGLTGVYEDFCKVFTIAEDFGAFLDNNFGSSALTHKAEAKDMTYNYSNKTTADILPVKSPFGFNFFTKVCPLFNFDQASANSDNPFGNMLPFLMLNGEKDGSFDPTLLFMVSAMNGGNVDFASNPMMLYCLMNRQDKGDILPFLMMNGGQMFGNLPTNVTRAPALDNLASVASK